MLKYFFIYHRFLLAAIAFQLFNPTGQWQSLAQDYLWPTTASKLITSSFCEFRPRHYHAAIDIKTWNRTGYPIKAIEDGYVLRARISSFGYGKAIYLKLKDGNIVVYAHLSKFWPELENYLNQQRLKNKEYRLDRQFTSQQFPVKRGQIIGYTGKSGIGYPHLHFEIRDPQNRPINPLRYYQAVFQDQTPPRLYQGIFFPMDYCSLINQRSDSVLFDMGRKQRFQLTDTLLFTGRIGLAIKCYDQAGGVSNEFSFYRAEMWIDDSLVYSVQYDRFSYQQSEKVELDNNFALWRQGQGVFHNFYIHPENDLPHYAGKPPESGIIDHHHLSEGLHHLTVNIFDYSENSASFETYFRFGDIPVLNYDLFRWIENDLFLRVYTRERLDRMAAQQRDQNGSWSLVPFQQDLVELKHDDIFYYTFSLAPTNSSEVNLLKIQGTKESKIPSFPLFINALEKRTSGDSLPVFETTGHKIKNNWLELSFRLHHSRPVTLLSDLNKHIPELFWFPVNEEIYQINIPVQSYLNHRQVLEKVFNLRLENLYFVDRNKHYTIESADQQFKAVFPPLALYDDTGVSINILNSSGKYSVPKKYRLFGKIYDLQPYTQAVDEGVRVSLALPMNHSSIKGVGLYYWDQKKGWQFIPAKLDTASRSFTARVTSLEKFTLIQDSLPPSILPGQSLNLTSIHNHNGVIKFFIKDELSGIQSESMIQVYLDGQWQLFEYDPEEDLITLVIQTSLTAPAVLQISAEDNVGNSSKKVYQIN
jgi:hypothetical protein